MLGASFIVISYQDISEKHSQFSYPLNTTHNNDFLRFYNNSIDVYIPQKYVFEPL